MGSTTTSAIRWQDWDYLFWWSCALCGRKTRSYIPFCQTVDYGAARWWAALDALKEAE